METEQNLVIAICPICKKNIKLQGGKWLFLSKIMDKFLPKKIMEDNCPECEEILFCGSTPCMRDSGQ